MNEQSASGKSPVVAWMLWLFLGCFGAHRFYFGKVKSGAGMLVLYIASFVLTAILIGFVGFLALLAWWIYDATQLGNWLKEGEFQPMVSDASGSPLPGVPAASSLASDTPPMSPPSFEQEAA